MNLSPNIFPAKIMMAVFFITLPIFSFYAINANRENPVISGNVFLMPGSEAFENVTLSFSGIGQTITNEDGYYEMEVPQGWNGIVTPDVCGAGFYAFEPPNTIYNNVTADITGQNYNAETDTSFIISGTITDKYTGAPLSNMMVLFEIESGGPPWSITVTTDDDGNYSFEQLPCWSNVVNPGVADGYYYLEPFTMEYENLSGDLENQDYTFVNYEYPAPPDWEYVQTGDAHIIAIETSSFPNICDVELELGDLIGVFFLDEDEALKCGGFGRWQDEKNVALIAQGDDDLTLIKEGFDYYEEMNWKVYSYGAEAEFLATPDYKTGGFLSSNNMFVPGGLSIVEGLDAVNYNLITIPSGWSGISSYTMPIGPPLIANIMEPISNDLIIVQSLDKVYYPAGGINNLLFWSYKNGYKIKVSSETLLPMHGCEQENKTVDLNSTWNLLPVLSNCPVDHEVLFAPILNSVQIVKEVAGTGIYWPEFDINTLQSLEPGRAYFVAVSQNTSITFNDCPALKTIKTNAAPKQINNSPWNTPSQTGSGHSLAFTSTALHSFNQGDYIGAFSTKGVCFGFVEIGIDHGNTAMTIFGDDASTTEKEGFQQDEIITLKAFKSGENKIFDLIPDYNNSYPHANGVFAENGISVIESLKWSSTGLPEIESQIHFYPNPATDEVTFSNYQKIPCQVTIINPKGQMVFEQTLRNNSRIDLTGYNSGIYFVRISGENFTISRKLIVE